MFSAQLYIRNTKDSHQLNLQLNTTRPPTDKHTSLSRKNNLLKFSFEAKFYMMSRNSKSNLVTPCKTSKFEISAKLL